MINVNNMAVVSGRVYNKKMSATPSGTEYARFSIMVSEKVKDEWKNTFIPCVAWSNTASFLDKYFKDGSAIQVMGSIEVNTIEKDGEKRTFVNVNVNTIAFPPKDKTDSKDKTEDDNIPDGFMALDDDEMPF